MNLCFLPILFLSVKLDLFSSYLILYIFSFYIYTFKTKFIKFFDLIFLNSFYIFRLLYGCDLVGIEISYWFIIFFSTLFFILSIFKKSLVPLQSTRYRFPDSMMSQPVCGIPKNIYDMGHNLGVNQSICFYYTRSN